MNRLHHLDMLRGVSAFLVLAGHLRAYTLMSFPELGAAGLEVGVIWKAFYFVTGLGHQAVIVFFALSGFLVGGKALNDILAKRFDWSMYMLRRLTRLWIVIIPILTLTFILDSIGEKLAPMAGYAGDHYNLYSSGPSNPNGPDHSLLTFLGNLAFLQNIYVPVFGTCGPIWSLSNEFWYYVAIPLTVWIGITKTMVRYRLIGIVILIAICIALPAWLLEGGVVWFAGAAAAWFARRRSFDKFLKTFITRVCAAMLFIAAILLSKSSGVDWGDIALGLSISAILPVFVHLPPLGRAYTMLADALSQISFTLYLSHFPILTLIIMVGFAPARLPPGANFLSLYFALLASAIVSAAVLWWFFERNTDRLYYALMQRLPSTRLSRP